MTSFQNLLHYITDFSKTDLTGSEANTKKRVIEPLLESLGWDLRSNEIRLEYPVRIGTRTAYVDYALMLEDKPVVFVEAKAFDESLIDDFCSQIISYGKVEDVKWVVLTNGKRIKVFDTKAGKNETECLVIEINLQELPSGENELRILSRESILTGEIEKTANRFVTTKKVISNLKRKQNELAEEFQKVLIEFTGPGLENRIRIVSAQLGKQTVKLFEDQADAPVSFEKEQVGQVSKVSTISRNMLSNKESAVVLLCTSRVEGIEFLEKYNAWGFIKLGKNRAPKYFALYIGRPKSSVMYFAEIETITQPLKSKEDIKKISKEDLDTFKAGKQVIHLKPNSLYKLEDPIPLINKKVAPLGHKYTTLEKFIKANSISDL
ncbi:MAG: type I restriction enzyme HsdR N-terminal domain-containing protein [Candidatus Bathyarchaeum tardum]|nr:MAG: type I restriction enzyme HsdR N-terminal domain-containing protein [Candidatus Bathyarchaeum tardum]